MPREIIVRYVAGTTPMISYLGEDGRPHVITINGLPPNNGVPPPPPPRQVTTPPAAPSHAVHLQAVPPRAVEFVEEQIYQPPPRIQEAPGVQTVDIRFMKRGIRPHRDRYTGRNRDDPISFILINADTNLRLDALIRFMCGRNDIGLSEVKLLADGRSWAEVQTLKPGNGSLHNTLAQVGWTEARRVDGPPVWVCPYRAGIEEAEEARYWQRQGFPQQ